MDSAQAAKRGTARLLAVCAVLFGLFLMHGAPSTAAEGCHGAMGAAGGTTTGMAGTPMTGVANAPVAGGHHTAMASSTPPVVDAASGPTMRGAASSGMPGTLCVSTPAHDRIPLPASGLLAVTGALAVVLWGPAGLRAAAGGTGRRGPPTGGRGLLLQVCVART
ncbi:hypothetical protein [Streptomyces sp. NPDC057616]|uniref:hypothetical protein n=1 Tax=Streptomyces sp. NPDC057616 TaxID=3346183 RepID=UPI0036BE7B2B